MTTRREALGLALALPLVVGAAPSPPRVETRDGVIEGVFADGVASFLGVRYGASTGGPNRFFPPKPVASWTGIRPAKRLGDRATQTPDAPLPRSPYATDYNVWASFEATEPESEDCLVLNVWTPEANDRRRRPVMVWLHPGGFATGAGAEPPTIGDPLARDGDLVVVSINHRLSALGYLYLDALDPAFAGSNNVGQLDQIAALKWVRENIANFGGDPGNVTIFGQSGGGAKVCTLMAMPGAHGLFHKAICESGSYIEATPPDLATQAALAIAADVGLDRSQIAKLREVPAGRIIRSARKVSNGPLARGFDPVLDGVNVPQHPFSPGALKLSRDIPLLIGTTKTEATALEHDRRLFEITWETLPDWWAKGFSSRAAFNTSHPTREVVASQIAAFRKAYPNETASQLFFRVSTDLWTTFNGITIADRKSEAAQTPVWMYEMDYHTPVDGGRWGSPHSLEVPMVFGNVAKAPSIMPDNAQTQLLSRQVMGSWIAFARSGDPNTSLIPAWPRYDTTRRPAMLFDTTCSVATDFRGPDRQILAGVPTLRV